MGQYGIAAVAAVHLITQSNLDPREAWDIAVRKSTKSMTSAKKGCPAGAFLGLCESGYVRGVKRGSYTQSKLNKDYAIKAAEMLAVEPSLCEDRVSLWRAVLSGESKAHNGQLDVVCALLEAGLLDVPAGRTGQ